MKCVGKVLAIILAFTLLMLGIIVTLINPNDYKEQIQNIVQKNINRQLIIKGNLSWNFFPTLGINIGELAIKNTTGFHKENLLKINNALVEIEVIPLFKGEIKLGVIHLNGLNVNIISSANGRTNLDDMGRTANKNTEPPIISTKKIAASKTKSSHGFFQLNKTSIAGIKVTNATIERQDLSKNNVLKIHVSNINIGAWLLGRETDFSISSDVMVNNFQSEISLTSRLFIPINLSHFLLKKSIVNVKLSDKSLLKKNIKLTLKSNISYFFKNNTFTFNNLSLKLNDIIASGKLSIQTSKKTKIRYDLSVNKMDLTPYLSKNNSIKTKAFSTQKSNTPIHSLPKPKLPLSQIEPDLSFLDRLNVKGDLLIDGVLINKINIGKITNHLTINNGKLTIKHLTAKLYDGSLLINASLSNKNKYQISSTFNGVQIQPLLTDLLNFNTFSGVTSLNFIAAGNGLSEYNLIHNIEGKGTFKLTNGKLYGMNISQELRILKVKFNHQYNTKKDYKKQTDVASLLGEFTIKNAIINNQSFIMQTPFVTLQGEGIIWPLTEKLNYKLNIKRKLKYQIANKKAGELNPISFPLSIKGSFKEPQFSIDGNALLKLELKKRQATLKTNEKRKLQNKLEHLIDKHLGKRSQDKVNKKIKHTLSKWLH